MRARGDASQFPIPRATQKLVILDEAKHIFPVSSRRATTRNFDA
jgi:hypothetical protein